MKNMIKLEEAALFGLSIYLFSLLGLSWWWFPLLILAPDIGMVGYAFGTKVGAITYNPRICSRKSIARANPFATVAILHFPPAP